MRRTLTAVLALGLSIMMADMALARIKLITLPVRERVEIQLGNPNATLVEEERILPLVKGVNQVDFSWANTQIDPNARPGDPQGELEERRQSLAVQLGQYPDRPDLGPAEVREHSRQAGPFGHDLPAHQASDAVLERPERDRGRSDRRDHVLHKRHQLVGRLRLDRQPG